MLDLYPKWRYFYLWFGVYTFSRAGFAPVEWLEWAFYVLGALFLSIYDRRLSEGMEELYKAVDPKASQK